MATSTTVTLLLNNVGGQIGALDGAINASVSASNNDGKGTIIGTITAIGNAAEMFLGPIGQAGSLAVTVSNLTKTGFDSSKLTISDVLTI